MSKGPNLELRVTMPACPHILEVAEDMCRISRMLNVVVTTDFNGTPATAYPWHSARDVANEWARYRDVFNGLPPPATEEF